MPRNFRGIGLCLILFCCGLFGLFGLTRSPAEDGQSGRKLALLVGVKEYDHAQLNNLQFPENDVEELADVLRKQKFEVVLLTTHLGKQDAKKLPTAANVKAELAKLLKDVTKRDLALIGLAGHGIQPLGSDRAYFCPKDANPKIVEGKLKEPSMVAFPDRLISIDDLLATLDDSGVGQKLLLVDACRNDPNVRGRRGVDRVKVSALPSETGVLLSCSSGQFAFEHKSWGQGGHGAFFAAVIDGLNGRAGQEGAVTWETLAPYVRRQVPVMVKKVYGKDGGEQRPNVIGNISEAPAVLVSVTPLTPLKPDRPVNTPEPSATTSASDTPPLAVAPFDADKAKQHQQAWAKHLKLPVELTNKSGMDLRLIPPGEFQMGSEEDPDDLLTMYPKWLRDQQGDQTIRGWLKAEQPAHKVRITKAFYLGKFEVSKGEFRKFVADTDYRTEPEKDGKGGYGWSESKKEFSQKPEYTWKDWGVEQSDESPVVNVTWNDAVKFCEWLSKKEGQKYRLPTEAEWEYACRAGTKTRFYNGNSWDGVTEVGNIQDVTWKEKFTNLNSDKAAESRDGYAFTSPRGKFVRNGWGLYDMHGNAWEWCADWYDEKYYASSPTDDPKGPVGGSTRVLRGGGWNLRPVDCRSAHRDFVSPSLRFYILGFRVAYSPSGQ